MGVDVCIVPTIGTLFVRGNWSEGMWHVGRGTPVVKVVSSAVRCDAMRWIEHGAPYHTRVGLCWVCSVA